MLSFLKGRKPLLGVDIGTSSVKTVQLKPHGKAYDLVHMGMAPLPPEAIVDGARRHGLRLLIATQPFLWRDDLTVREEGSLWLGGVGIARPYFVGADEAPHPDAAAPVGNDVAVGRLAGDLGNLPHYLLPRKSHCHAGATADRRLSGHSNDRRTVF